ncbi:MAG: PQQ-binding-like beta-propeller repeat protein [Bacteroidetes bacterium]|nr:PQQ-binding-like beta-propeller repeat protein [Bacteroidota bacterium]
MMRILRVSITATLVLIQVAFFNVNAQSTTQWRGVGRSGEFPSEGLFGQWPEGGPKLLLHVDELPESYSSVVVKDEVIYTTGIEEGDEILTALNPDGSTLWITRYGDAWGKSFRAARCTPTIEDGYAYLISGAGDLACVDLGSGKLSWTVDGYTAFGAVYGSWGTAESPLIVDDMMIYTPCGETTTMVAVDKSNGNTIWTSESIQDQSSYTSPLLIEREGYKLIVSVTGNNVICVNAADGEIFWQLEYTAIDKPMMGGDINPVTPLSIGNEIFITSGYNHTGVMLEMADDYRSVSVKWKSGKLDVHHGGVVVVEGYLYGSNYTTIRSGNWVCLDWETGELMYEEDWYTKGQVITSGGMLICYDERKGNMALVEATPERFSIKSEFRIDQGSGPHWSHPSIYEGKLYLRHGKSLLVYRVGQ